MEKTITKYNKATLIAAALIITGATAIFGTYASTGDEDFLRRNPNPFSCFEQVDRMTEEQKAKVQEAQNLFQAGDKEGAKLILDDLGIKPPLGASKK